MKIADIIKKQTSIIAIAVIVITIAVIGVSYAIFFDVKEGKTQVIKAGQLKLTVDDLKALSQSEPMSTTAGLASSPATYTVKNEGDLPAAYSIYVYAENDNTIPISAIKLSTDGTSSEILSNIGSTDSSKKFTESGITYFKIDGGTLAANKSSNTKNLRLWIDDSLLTEELSEAKLNISLYIVSEVQE